jgi:hypothetical protein
VIRPWLVPLLAGAAVLGGLVLPGAWGVLALYPLLGLAPGAAVAWRLPFASDPLSRVALALALSPLAATVAAWPLVGAGLPIRAAAWIVAATGVIAWMLQSRRGAKDGAASEPFPWTAVACASVAAGAVALVFFANPYIQVRADGWVHAGIVWEILTRGIPPEDPRFAGLPLNYVWFYNFFVALVASLRGHDPFPIMAIGNSVLLGTTFLTAWAVGRRLWGAPAALGTGLLGVLGFNAGAWMLWPLRLLRAVVGRDRGLDFSFELAQIHLGDARVIFNLSAPFSYMASFLDKFLIGTALSYAYLLLGVYLWAMVVWFGENRRAALFVAASAACGMLLFHGVVGLSAIPCAVAAVAFAIVLRVRLAWLPTFGQGAWFVGATLAGTLAAAPYTISIARGWASEQSGLEHSYFGIDHWMLWTIASAVAVAAWFAARPLRDAFRHHRQAAVMLAFFAAFMLAFAAVVRLTLGNHVKFVYQVFLPLAFIGGVAWSGTMASWRARLGNVGFAIVFALVFLGAPALTLVGYLLDPGGKTHVAVNAPPEERALHGWFIADTPPDAVVVDRDARDDLMVLAHRQLFLGTKHGPELAAFPADQLRERRAAVDDIYGPAVALGDDAALLDRLERPTYVVYRTAEFPNGERPWTALEMRPDLFERAYAAGGLLVYHLGPIDRRRPETRQVP